MIGTCIASGCAAFACWLSMVTPRAASRLPDIGQWANHDEPVVVADAAWTMLVLRMVQVSLRQGASVPRALDVVGRAVGGAYGQCLSRVGESLLRGVSWSDAWCAALAGTDASAGMNHSARLGGAKRRGRSGQHGDTDGGAGDIALGMIRESLEPAWLQGDSPGVLIDAAVEQLDKDERARIERAAARLSVRLLMPTGLCFLPAFVIVGVLPAIASFLM